MKQVYITMLAFLGVFSACTANSAKQEEEQTTEVSQEFPKSFYKKMTGTIGDNIPVTFDLVKTDSTLQGTYYYNKVKQPLTLTGRFINKTEVEFSEVDDNGEITGRFEGEFTDANTLEGAWFNPENSKTLPFKLTEINENVASATFEYLSKENCAIAELNKKLPADEISELDTTCSSITVEMIKIEAQNPTATEKINKAIAQAIADASGEGFASVQDLLNSVDNIGKEEDDYEFLTLDVTSSIVTNDDNILSILVSEDFYAGGPHPTSSGRYLNFDLATGQRLILDDILVKGYEERLNRIGERIFWENAPEEFSPEDWDFEQGQLEMTKNFAILPHGLLFSYQSYELGAYVMGAPQVFIPYKEIKGLIAPNGKLATWMKDKSLTSSIQ